MLIDFSLNLQLSTLNRLPPAVSRWLKPPLPSNWRADRRKIPSKSSWEGRRVAVPDLQKESPKNIRPFGLVIRHLVGPDARPESHNKNTLCSAISKNRAFLTINFRRGYCTSFSPTDASLGASQFMSRAPSSETAAFAAISLTPCFSGVWVADLTS